MKKFLFALVLMMPMFAFTGCGNDDEPQDISVSDQSLLVGQTYSLPSGAWTSSNDAVAKVEGGKVVAIRRGEATIKGSSKSFKVEVSPSNNIIPDPYLQFGGSHNDVADYMASLGGFDRPGLSLVQTYVSKNPTLGYQYTFKNGEGLQDVTVMAFKKDFEELEIAEYLKQRYVPVMEQDGVFGFLSLDKKILVAFTIEVIKGNITYIIVYKPN